ncbi:MAG: hypothetical protein VX642_00400 [Bdellovibrionota bacterium]|nr:hypothetical protein [Bdellovibrionota bacterium]
MKAFILFTISCVLGLSAFSQTGDQIYRAFGQIHFERTLISCEVQNNLAFEDAIVRKITFDLICEDPYGRPYNELHTIRCGEDFENCEIPNNDYEIYEGPNYRICHRVVAARCPFTYTIIEDEQP